VNNIRHIELLAPARNADIGIEAIRHGADAVYIGAERFGARVAAGNSVEDIARLVKYAHLYSAKVYVTVNTIFRDEELKDVEQLAWQLYEAGVDALIIQDMGLLKLNLPPIPLHASTQMDNRNAEKVRFLKSAGFNQVVLARELSLNEIQEIHEACPDTILEVFVHGALCVSMSGQCYISEACFGRSANRGECAQVCRMKFDLEDSEGRKLVKDKHLLSLKDLCQIDELEGLLKAGASSFKIEGRLKDADYVKNVTAAYSQALDTIVRRHPEKYRRASLGTVRHHFTPDVSKSFNRGFTHYFLHGRQPDIFSFDTPKSLGEEVGTVKDIFNNHFTVAGLKTFSNGDGLCFIDSNGKLHGFRINKAENGRLYPLEMPSQLKRRTRLYRNQDHAFQTILSKESAERVLFVDIEIEETEKGFRLTMTDDYHCAYIDVEAEKQLGRTPQSDNVKRQLSKLGGTGLELRSLNINYGKNWFIPSSLLTEWRRSLVKEFLVRPIERPTDCNAAKTISSIASSQPNKTITYLGNVMNMRAAEFYREHGVEEIEPAFELKHKEDVPLMFCRHCIRYSLNMCPKHHGNANPQEQLFLRLANGKRFRLEFDCKSCMMKVYES
jgi:putative protease